MSGGAPATVGHAVRSGPDPVDGARASVLVLVIEDDQAIREMVIEILGHQGFRVASAPNGAEALLMLDEGERPGLILLDLMMPVMDGWEFRLAQRRDPRLADIPVIVLSAGAGLENRLAGLGADAFIPKPFDLDHLLGTVCRVSGLTRH